LNVGYRGALGVCDTAAHLRGGIGSKDIQGRQNSPAEKLKHPRGQGLTRISVSRNRIAPMGAVGLTRKGLAGRMTSTPGMEKE
jgi:hypothetical protein